MFRRCGEPTGPHATATTTQRGREEESLHVHMPAVGGSCGEPRLALVLPCGKCQVILTFVSVLVAVEHLPDDPLSALRVLTESEHELERIRREQVVAARAAGASWQQIGDALGVTRQSAWESFTAETRAALSANVDANSTLAEDDAVDLAIEEVRAVRRRGATS